MNRSAYDQELAHNLDQYVCLLRQDAKKAEIRLNNSRWEDPNSELVEFCDAFRKARKHAVREGFILRESKPVARPVTPIFPWISIILLLLAAFFLIYAGQHMATLERDNKILRKQLEQK